MFSNTQLITLIFFHYLSIKFNNNSLQHLKLICQNSFYICIIWPNYFFQFWLGSHWKKRKKEKKNQNQYLLIKWGRRKKYALRHPICTPHLVGFVGLKKKKSQTPNGVYITFIYGLSNSRSNCKKWGGKIQSN